MIDRSAVAFACLLAVSVPAVAQDASIVGNWDATIALAQGPQAVPLVLKKEGDRIVGTLSGPHGDVPIEASVKGKAVTFWFTVPTENGPLNMAMTGLVDGDTMSGSIDFGDRGQAQWSAKRAAAAGAVAADAALDVTGTWTFAVETGARSGTPTITLTQSGAKLTGQYKGQLGEAPLTGTLKGTAIEFAIDVSVQETAVHVVYAGTADKSAMKGTVRLGDMGEGTFTARKTP